MKLRLPCMTLAMTAFLAVPTVAHAVEIASPANQSAVKERTTVTVTGRDCPAGDTVRVAFTGSDETGASTTADTDGSWTVGLPVPDFPSSNAPESQEAIIEAECAAERATVLVVAVPAEAGARDELPHTGPARATATATLGSVLIVLGVAMGYAARRRGVHEATGPRCT